MKDLTDQMKVALADSFAFYLKAHGFHWNIEGSNFPQYHSFFGSIYEEVWDAVDAIAEHLRTLDVYAPASFSRFKELATIEEEINIPKAIIMVGNLNEDNQKVITSLSKAYELAEKHKKHGLSNFLQDRIDKHEKWGWQLRAMLRT